MIDVRIETFKAIHVARIRGVGRVMDMGPCFERLFRWAASVGAETGRILTLSYDRPGTVAPGRTAPGRVRGAPHPRPACARYRDGLRGSGTRRRTERRGTAGARARNPGRSPVRRRPGAQAFGRRGAQASGDVNVAIEEASETTSTSLLGQPREGQVQGDLLKAVAGIELIARGDLEHRIARFPDRQPAMLAGTHIGTGARSARTARNPGRARRSLCIATWRGGGA